MPKRNSLPKIQVGPFAAAADNIYDFGTGLYLSYLYEQTVSELLEAERELDVARKMSSEESEIKDLQEKVYFLESVVTLATQNYDSSLEFSEAEH